MHIQSSSLVLRPEGIVLFSEVFAVDHARLDQELSPRVVAVTVEECVIEIKECEIHK